MTAPGRDLRDLFDPCSVVIAGASDDPRKWGNWLARAALPGPRPVHLVNPGRDRVLGRPAYRSVGDVPGPVGLVAVCVPAPLVAAVVDDALAAGARAIVAISAGLGETGPAGRRLERDIAGRVRAAGALLLGPNCLGVFDAASRLSLTSNPLPPGRVAFLSQSGNLSLDLAGLLAEHGLGFSRFASLGNQADVDLAELIDSCADHAATGAVAVYCEQFTDGRRFAAAARRAGKPVVLLSAGSSAATTRIAASHTGSMVSDAAVVAAACASAGVHVVHSPGELADLLAVLAAPARPAGRRLGILTDGGGHAAVAAGLAERAGLAVPALPAPLRARVAAHLPGHAGTANPVDVAGGAEQDPDCLSRVAADVLGSGEVDALVLSGYFGGYAEYGPDIAAAELAVAARLAVLVRQTGRPVLVQTPFAGGSVADALRAGGIPVFRRAESAITALGRAAPGADNSKKQPPRTGGADNSKKRRVGGSGGAGRADGLVIGGLADYWSARRLLAAAGVPFPAARLVRDAGGLAAAAAELAPPWALKANGLAHKSDAGGVLLDLADAAQLHAAHAGLTSRLNPDGCVVEEMITSAGAELIAGVRRDERFGPVAMVGLGGIHAEMLADIRLALAPLDAAQALDMLTRLRGAALLTGGRGRAPLAIEAAAGLIALITQVAADHQEITELEVNPVLVTSEGALALDARIVTAGGSGDDGR